MVNSACLLLVAGLACFAAAEPANAAAPVRGATLAAAIETLAADHAYRLEQSTRRARLPGRTCKARVCVASAIGAGAGAVFGALQSDDPIGGAALGAMIFGILGAGFGYMSCGP